MFTDETYKVGIYLRLSKDEEKDKEKEENPNQESKSIRNQREYIWEYIKENKLTYVDEYVDDGASGGNFERDGFERMKKDLESKRINMVITKDLSRLGRDHIETGFYAERYFPENRIRYVALADRYDSIDPRSHNILMKFAYNDMVLQDTSIKIIEIINSKKRQGLFMGGIAPYGYKRNIPINKHELIIDEEVKDIVIRIFEMFNNGIGIQAICNTFTDENIPIPSVHQKQTRGNKSTTFGIWKAKTIENILTNPTYMGDLTQRREKKVSYKSKKRIRTKKDEWIIAKGACPAIVSAETFEIAQNIYSKNKNRSQKSHEYLFRGFLVCKECGHSISINEYKWKKQGKEVKKHYCYCNYYKKYRRYSPCTPHKLDYDELEKNLLKEIKKWCKKYLKTNNFETLLKNNDKTLKMQYNLEMKKARIENEIVVQNKCIDKALNDFYKGDLTNEVYTRQYNFINDSIKRLDEEKKEIDNQLLLLKGKAKEDDSKYTKVINEYLQMKKPSKKMLSSLIDKIEIDENLKIKVYYKIKPLFQ